MHDYDEDLRWDDLRYLLAVQRFGSFTAAAASVGVEQSTVSRRIAALEARLDAPLFDRTARGPVPTELAQALFAHAERVEAAVHGCLDAARGHARGIDGRVRLATTESFAVHVVIPKILPALRARHPRLHIDLVLGDRAADLGRREADIAIRFFRTKEGDLVDKRVARLATCVLASPEYAARCPRDPASLDWITFVLPQVETADERFVREQVGAIPTLRTTSHLAQVEAVRAGLGVALLTRALGAIVPGLVELPLALPRTPPVDIHLVAPRTLREVPRVAAVWEALEDALAPLAEPKAR